MTIAGQKAIFACFHYYLWPIMIIQIQRQILKLSFLGPRKPLEEPSISVHLSAKRFLLTDIFFLFLLCSSSPPQKVFSFYGCFPPFPFPFPSYPQKILIPSPNISLIFLLRFFLSSTKKESSHLKSFSYFYFF